MLPQNARERYRRPRVQVAAIRHAEGAGPGREQIEGADIVALAVARFSAIT